VISRSGGGSQQAFGRKQISVRRWAVDLCIRILKKCGHHPGVGGHIRKTGGSTRRLRSLCLAVVVFQCLLSVRRKSYGKQLRRYPYHGDQI
jgi:hypothetical protein